MPRPAIGFGRCGGSKIPTTSTARSWFAIAAWGVWDRRRRWRTLPGGPDGRAWWLLGPALLLHLAAVALTIDSLSALSLLVTVPAAAWLAAGGPRTREVLSALMALAFAVPPPLRVTGEFVFRLKELAMGAALQLANLFGEIVVRDGHLLRVTLAAPADAAAPYGCFASLTNAAACARSSR